MSLIHSILYEKYMLNFYSQLTFTAIQDIVTAVISTIETKNNHFTALGTNSAVHWSCISRLVKNDSKD